MNKYIRALICIVTIGVFVFSAWQIYSILQSRQIAKKHYSSYEEFIVKETDFKEISEKDKENSLDFNLDFNKLSEEYPDVIGWLHFENKSISYPVMQSKDNLFYLTHLPDGTGNSSGSIFADYRNNVFGEDDNFIVYGHNMKNDTMFGLLDEYSSQEHYEKYPHYYYLTAEKIYKIDLIAGCVVSSDSDIYKTNFDKNDMSQVVKSLVKISTFSSKTKYKQGDKLMTLSTCSASDKERYILVGVIN